MSSGTIVRRLGCLGLDPLDSQYLELAVFLTILFLNP